MGVLNPFNLLVIGHTGSELLYVSSTLESLHELLTYCGRCRAAATGHLTDEKMEGPSDLSAPVTEL